VAKQKLAIQIVEIEKSYVLPELDSNSAGSVASLQGHPGWQYLMARLRNQSALLTAALTKTRHKDIKDVEFLQSGINWCHWLDDQCTKATGMIARTQPAREMRPAELENFERLRSQIDVVGVSNTVDNDE
jgi:hypothetical protein